VPRRKVIGVMGGGSVSAEVFGITLAGVDISTSFHAEGSGRTPLVLKVKVKIKLLFFSIDKTARFHLGYLSLPEPIYLAGPLDPSAIWPQETGGDLYLNVGARGSYRHDATAGLSEDDPLWTKVDPDSGACELDETFYIRQTGGDATGGTIAVTAYGRTRTYQNVTRLYADAGLGTDMIVFEDVSIPVYVTGGDGDDIIYYRGSGYARIDGGENDDYIDFAGASGDLYGGAGNDLIKGGPGDDHIYGQDDDDKLIGNGGVDTIETGDGFRYIWRWRGLSVMLFTVALIPFVNTPAWSLIPLLVREHFHGGPAEWGWFSVARNVGSLIGGILMSSWGGFKRRMVTMVSGLFVLALVNVVRGLLPGDAYWLFLLAAFISGPAAAMFFAALKAVLQSTVPPEIQGRVFATQNSLFWAMGPLGLAILGPLADVIGIQTLFLLSGAAFFLVALTWTLTPSVRNLESEPLVVDAASRVERVLKGS